MAEEADSFLLEKLLFLLWERNYFNIVDDLLRGIDCMLWLFNF